MIKNIFQLLEQFKIKVLLGLYKIHRKINFDKMLGIENLHILKFK